MFKPDHMPVLNILSSELNIVKTVRYWDKAATKDGTGSSTASYTAGVKMCVFRNGQFLILDVVRGRWGTDEREAIIKSTAINDGRNVHIGLEQEPGSAGKDGVQATIRNLAGFSVTADRPTGDKAYRADPFSVQVNNGNVILMNADWNKAFKEELEMFPNGTYKDQVDAAAAAFNMLAGKKQVKVIR